MGMRPSKLGGYKASDIKNCGIPFSAGAMGNMSEAKFHKNWNWLMPVVNKIENDGDDFYVTIGTLSTKIERINFDTESGMETIVEHHVNTIEKRNQKIRVVYSAVLEFIRWYNK